MIRFASYTDEKNMRDLVIQYAQDHSLCKEGVNEFLNDAGMSPWENHHKIEVHMVIIVHEDDSDNLQTKLEDAVTSMNWDHDNNAVVEFSENTLNYEVEV